MKWEDAERLAHKQEWLLGEHPSWVGTALLVVGIAGCLVVGLACWPLVWTWEKITGRHSRW